MCDECVCVCVMHVCVYVCACVMYVQCIHVRMCVCM